MIRDMTSEDLKELIEALRTCRQPIPVGDDQIIIELAERARIRDVLRGDIVIRQGEETNDLYFVMSGQLRAADTSGDEPILLNYHAARAFVGEQSPLTGRPRAATVDAISDSKLAVWDQASYGRTSKTCTDIERHELGVALSPASSGTKSPSAGPVSILSR